MFPSPNSIGILSVIHIKDVNRSSRINKRKKIFDPNLFKNSATFLESSPIVKYLNKILIKISASNIINFNNNYLKYVFNLQ